MIKHNFKMEELSWDKSGGLIPAVVQDGRSGRVLMQAFMSPEALKKSMESGRVTFWSRTRQSLWTKGETSGHFLKLVEIRADCDADSLLAIVEPQGPTCHRGTLSCFGEDQEHAALEFLSHLEQIIVRRKKEMPPGSYTTHLFESGKVEISKKLGEEAVELIVSTLQSRSRVVEEGADLVYHLLVFLASQEISLAEVVAELRQRHSPQTPRSLD